MRSRESIPTDLLGVAQRPLDEFGTNDGRHVDD